MQAKFAKISFQKDQAEQSLQQMGEMFAERMAAATTRKSMLDSESQEKVEGHGSKRQELAVSFQKSKDANVSTKKLELDGNLASAVERKQALMNAKTAKVTEYLTRAYERGQEAMKRKEEMSLNGHEVEDPMMGMSLSSITEEQATEEQVFDPFDPKHNDGDDDGDEDGGFDGAMEDLALLWLDDENSVASFSTTGTNSSKSKVQARLERYYEDQKPKVHPLQRIVQCQTGSSPPTKRKVVELRHSRQSRVLLLCQNGQGGAKDSNGRVQDCRSLPETQ